jgi:2-polyprenyl-3-methyl-5-hydroxy-6-metoxy-1,4-benzoquinol methylase
MTVAHPKYRDLRFNADDNRWEEAKVIIGSTRVTLGPQASQQWIDAPDHLAFVLARYRAATALIGGAKYVSELGCGEGIGARILAKGRENYTGFDLDIDGIGTALQLQAAPNILFFKVDILRHLFVPNGRDAVVSLDVIEHIPADREADFMGAITSQMTPHGVCVIGTPSKNAEHLASPQSRVGHINLYTPDRLKTLMGRYFHVVQMLYMQDTAIHLGHPELAHYILACGIGPR